VRIDKEEIVQMLRDRGEHDKAEQAKQQLPDKVDHEQHSGLLERFGINPQELMSKL